MGSRFPLTAWMLKFRHYAAAVGTLVLLTWAGWSSLRAEAVRVPAFIVEQQESSMISWVHWLGPGASIRVEVYRRDYATEAEYDAAVAAKLVLYPPNQEPT